MDIFILDPLLRPIDIVDQYISFLWTERWSTMGDFQIETLATPDNKRRFVADAMLWIPQSKRIMIVEKIEEVDNVEKGNVLTVNGRSLDLLLQKRFLAHISTVDSTIDPTFDSYGYSPPELLRLYFFYICYTGTLSSGDIIPFLQPDGTTSLYPTENILDTWPSTFQWTTKPMDMYAAFQAITTSYDVGWRFYKDPNASKLYFEAVLGCDRTTQQTTYTPVIFSHDMANLIDTTSIVDTTPYYNAVWVVYFYKDTGGNDVTMRQLVTAPELAFSSGGFQQKTKLLSVTQIPDGMALVDVPAYLTQLGQAELGKSQTVNVYDGEVSQSSSYLYERDYNLGDIVEVRGDDGGVAYMRVVEQIFKSDSSGDASYPSLITRSFITPGSWGSWKYDRAWSSMADTEYWANQ